MRESFYRQGAYIPSPYVCAIDSKIEYNVLDLWVARSIPFDADNEIHDMRRWAFALRYVRKIFSSAILYIMPTTHSITLTIGLRLHRWGLPIGIIT